MADISIVATVELGGTVPRVRLDVTDANLPENFSATIMRNTSAGRQTLVRTADGNPLVLTTSGVTRVGTVYDYEAPFGESVTYTAVEDPDAVSAQVTVAVDEVWLIHPGVPELSMPISVNEFGPRSRAVVQGVFRPLGRREPIVHSDGQRKSSDYTLVVNTRTEEERLRLEVLLEDTTPLLLNVPATNAWGIGAEYVSIGTSEESRLYEYAAEPRRVWTLPCTVTARPVGGSQAERTWVDVIGNYATWADVMAAYPTWLDVITGP